MATEAGLSADSSRVNRQIPQKSITSTSSISTSNYSPLVPYKEGMYKDSIDVDCVYEKIPQRVWDGSWGITPEQARYAMVHLTPSKDMDSAVNYIFNPQSPKNNDSFFVGRVFSQISTAARVFREYSSNLKGAEKDVGGKK